MLNMKIFVRTPTTTLQLPILPRLISAAMSAPLGLQLPSRQSPLDQLYVHHLPSAIQMFTNVVISRLLLTLIKQSTTRAPFFGILERSPQARLPPPGTVQVQTGSRSSRKAPPSAVVLLHGPCTVRPPLT